MTDTTANKDVVRQYFEDIWNEKRRDRIPELLADDYVGHWFAEEDVDREGLAAFFDEMTGGFSDLTFDVQFMVAEDDLVTAVWTATGTHDGELMGFEPSGERGTVPGQSTHRVEDGAITEAWLSYDTLRMASNIGAVPEELAPPKP